MNGSSNPTAGMESVHPGTATHHGRRDALWNAKAHAEAIGIQAGQLGVPEAEEHLSLAAQALGRAASDQAKAEAAGQG